MSPVGSSDLSLFFLLYSVSLCSARSSSSFGVVVTCNQASGLVNNKWTAPAFAVQLVVNTLLLIWPGKIERWEYKHVPLSLSLYVHTVGIKSQSSPAILLRVNRNFPLISVPGLLPPNFSLAVCPSVATGAKKNQTNRDHKKRWCLMSKHIVLSHVEIHKH